MNILLIAYCIGAGRGSEPGVGWNVARGLALQGHQITVISTNKYRDENQKSIEKEGLSIKLITQDFPESCWTRSYKIWQRRIGPVIQQEIQEQQYDVIHHITFNQYRAIRDVFYTSLPALIGPIGGAESVPLPLLCYGSLPISYKIKEALRYLPWDAIPFIRRVNKAKQPVEIICSNQITEKRLHKGLFRVKTNICTAAAICIHSSEICETSSPSKENPYILFDGGLSRPQKGTWLMIGALNQLWTQNCHIPVCIVGLTDNEKSIIRRKATQMGLPEEALRLYSSVPRSQMLELMRHATVMLSTVYRDSGAMALLEALAQGTRIVCLDIPSQLWLTPEMACKVPVQRSRSKMEGALSDALKHQINAPAPDSTWHNKRVKFLQEHMTWESRINMFVDKYKALVSANTQTTNK